MNLRAKHFYEFGPFRIDAEQELLTRDGQVVALTPKVFETLVCLVEKKGDWEAFKWLQTAYDQREESLISLKGQSVVGRDPLRPKI
jgi:DNA-binding response OmpR family regulator